jgi:hypothetical protein
MREDDGWGGGLDEQAKKLIYIYKGNEHSDNGGLVNDRLKTD